MKKLLFIALIGLGLTTLTSCYKSYTCTCTSQTFNGAITNTTKTDISSLSKNNAIDKCEESNSVVGTVTTYCALD